MAQELCNELSLQKLLSVVVDVRCLCFNVYVYYPFVLLVPTFIEI